MSKATSPVKSMTAYDLIRELILSGEFLPGTRLVLAELEEKLQVGRGPIREAIMRLDKSGLVQNIPYKGAIVTHPPSFREMECMYELRILVECQLAKETMRIITTEELASLEQMVEEMHAACADEPFFFHKDREFHTALYSISKLPHLQTIVDRLLDHVEIFLNTRYYEPQDTNLFLEQHRKMIQAIKEKNEITLCHTLSQNILVGLEQIRSEMERFLYRSRHVG